MARGRSLREFQTSFPDETSCAAFLFERRWPQGFVCPACGAGRAAFLRSRAHTYECLDCGRQTSITAGTVMHRSKLPADGVVLGRASHGDALERHVGSPARGPARHHIQDGLVAGAEAATIDDRSPPRAAGGRGGGRPGRSSFPGRQQLFDPVKSGKILIAGAVEVIDRGTNQAKPRRKRAKYLDTRSGRIRLAAIPDTRRLRSRLLCGPT